MTHNHDILLSRAKALRKMCTAAHNRLLKDIGRSPLGDLVDALAPALRFENGTPGHLLLSSYVYWGSRKLGGSRSGFERRLERKMGEIHGDLHLNLRQCGLAVWKCLNPGDETSSMTWQSVGLPTPESCTVDLVCDAHCKVERPKKDELRAGWLIEEEGATLFMFSMALDGEAAKRIEETAARGGWDDPVVTEGVPFQRREYERDLLTQAVCPKREVCGLQEFYFLPPKQREEFPDKFRRNLLRRVVDRLRFDDRSTPWHIQLATADDAWLDEHIRPLFEGMRQLAGRQAVRYRGRRVEPELLARIVADDQVLSLVGLKADGTLTTDPFMPVDTHRLSFLDLEDSWFEASGIGHDTTIFGARRQLEDGELGDQFEQAISRHRSRLRWLGIAEFMVENRDFDTWTLRLEYGDVRAAVEKLFGPILRERPVAQLLAGYNRAALIEEKLGQANLGELPLVVGQLPEIKGVIKRIRGIGPTSVETITEALMDSMKGWATELRHTNSETDEEAMSEIETGLDELDALFD